MNGAQLKKVGQQKPGLKKKLEEFKLSVSEQKLKFCTFLIA